MLHAQLVIHRLTVDGAPHVVRYGAVMVAARAESAQLDWEVVVQVAGTAPDERRAHALGLTVISGADEAGAPLLGELVGSAILVRSVEGTCVFRGDGPLDGFDLSSLRG